MRRKIVTRTQRFFVGSFVLLAFLFLAPPTLLFAFEEPEKTRAAEFTLKSLDGHEVQFSQFRGKYVLLNFWATWCGPCKTEMPSLDALYQRFKSQNLEVIGISNDAFGEKVVRPFVDAHDISFPVLLDPNLKVSYRYGVVNLPTTFLIDPDGHILGALHGAEDWAEPETLLYFENLLNHNKTMDHSPASAR